MPETYPDISNPSLQDAQIRQSQNPLMPYLNEQALTLADKVVVRSTDIIPDEVYKMFWNVFGLDLIVNNFNESDVTILDLQVMQTCMDYIGHIPLAKLRHCVEITLPVKEQIIEKVEQPDGTIIENVVGYQKVFKVHVIEGLYWDVLINQLRMKAMAEAKRSRGGFTMDKLTSFKTVLGQQGPEKKEAKLW